MTKQPCAHGITIGIDRRLIGCSALMVLMFLGTVPTFATPASAQESLTHALGSVDDRGWTASSGPADDGMTHAIYLPIIIGLDPGHATLPSGDGWASVSPGTTGGSQATADHTYTVANRKELVAALNDGVYPPPSLPSNTPKIIYVKGTIDANVDDNNTPLTCVDYYRNGYTLEAFLAAYDPAVWGYVPPVGPLEDARIASGAAQQARVMIPVGSNTTIVGLGDNARIRGANLWVQSPANIPGNRSNIIIRNITFQDTYDCFPKWDPTDGNLGRWNSLYDSISLRAADHVWIDHSTFEDVETADDRQPDYFGVLYQVHDGELDIIRGADLVTVSWNRFQNHDKVMLIGSSDSETADRGKLRVTLHHNLFQSTTQRTPRVRFGRVHVYNNYYIIDPAVYWCSWGIGIESAIYAQNNFFASHGRPPEWFICPEYGTAIYESGTYTDDPFRENPVDVLAAYNAAYDPDLSSDVGWAPTLYPGLDNTQDVPATVSARAGPFKW